MIIDIHTHAWPDKVSERAREHLELSFRRKLVANPTVDTLLRFMDKNGVDVSVICAVASRPDQVSSINDWLFGVRNERIRIFCALHPEYGAWRDELRRIRERGDGIKLQPEFQDFYVDQENVFPIYETIQALELPLLFHCGEELSGTMLVRSSPPRLLKVKKKFPRMKIVAAHFGGFQLWQEVKENLLGEDIYLDTSFFFDYLPRPEVKEMLLAHRPDRLLFGTDFPLVDQKKDLDFLRGLGLDAALEERILSGNARQLLGW